MQQVNIQFSTTNAAFVDDDPGFEVARILRKLADKLETDGVPGDEYPLHDVNGNRVGECTIQ